MGWAASTEGRDWGRGLGLESNASDASTSVEGDRSRCLCIGLAAMSQEEFPVLFAGNREFQDGQSRAAAAGNAP